MDTALEYEPPAFSLWSLTCEVLKRQLDRLGYDVATRHSGVEALDAFRSHPQRFDLVITDQTMPHMTGVELAQELLRVRPGVPIILCTGFSETVDEQKAKTLGIRGFLMKPALAAHLAQKIREVLES